MCVTCSRTLRLCAIMHCSSGQASIQIKRPCSRSGSPIDTTHGLTILGELASHELTCASYGCCRTTHDTCQCSPMIIGVNTERRASVHKKRPLARSISLFTPQRTRIITTTRSGEAAREPSLVKSPDKEGIFHIATLTVTCSWEHSVHKNPIMRRE